MKTQWIEFHGLSMHPFLREGDSLEVDMSAANFSSGDIVLYKDRSNGELVAHRIVNKDFQTKGDFSIVMDQNSPNDFLGRVISLKRNDQIYVLNRHNLVVLFSRLRLRGPLIRKFALLGLLLSEKFLSHPK